MWAYFLRRLLLVPVTFVCITFLVYAILRLVPGGPVEQEQRRMREAASGEAGVIGGGEKHGAVGQLPEKELQQLRQYFRVDRSIPVAYLMWLGVWPVAARPGGPPQFSGVLQGDLMVSFVEGRPVTQVITGRFYISLYFGLIGYFASWLVCVPLGVMKAIRHRSLFDTGTSVVVFLGYSIPGFVACLLLLVFLGGGSYWNWVPLGGFRPPKEVWETLSAWGQFKAQLHHTLVPMFGYMIGGFASMTILMKNSLLENFGADYVRTAFAKGLSERRVIFVHALRNSLIPITAGIGHALGLLFAGSFLIEKTCNIPGMGYLGFTAILAVDFPVIMGVLVFTSLIMLTGNIISDLIWALIDPRIRFGASR